MTCVCPARMAKYQRKYGVMCKILNRNVKFLLVVDGTGETGATGPWIQELPISTSIWLSGGRGEPPSSDMQQGST